VAAGATFAYGLTDGGYNATEISLTELGRRAVAPTREGDDLTARAEALVKPRVLKAFFEKYDRAKFPRDDIAQNVLIELGVPKDRAPSALAVLKANGQFAGVIQQTKTGPFIALGHPVRTQGQVPDDLADGGIEFDHIEMNGHSESAAPQQRIPATAPEPTNSRVFITHGRNVKILDQIKKIVSYGKFEAVVAKERETAAKPVPEKVMDEMRGCRAAVIHVGLDGILLDTEGNEHPQINPNVLIEIGAAMALCRRSFILLVEDGVRLPSNLQGLYECRYSGDGLDMEATMKLLEAFNDFR
jgi:predicted nucleotide-binding protein